MINKFARNSLEARIAKNYLHVLNVSSIILGWCNYFAIFDPYGNIVSLSIELV